MNSSSINIANSFKRESRSFDIPGIGNRTITLGDRLFARLVMKGQTIMEFIVNTVRDLSELFCLVHSKCKGLRGLAKLYLRNMSQGWSEERPLMLYPSTENKKSEEKRVYNAQPSTTVRIKNVYTSPYFTKEVRQLSFPWQL